MQCNAMHIARNTVGWPSDILTNFQRHFWRLFLVVLPLLLFLLVCTSYMHVKIFFITSPRLILNRLHYSFVRSKLVILHPIVSFVDEMNIF